MKLRDISAGRFCAAFLVLLMITACMIHVVLDAAPGGEGPPGEPSLGEKVFIVIYFPTLIMCSAILARKPRTHP